MPALIPIPSCNKEDASTREGEKNRAPEREKEGATLEKPHRSRIILDLAGISGEFCQVKCRLVPGGNAHGFTHAAGSPAASRMHVRGLLDSLRLFSEQLCLSFSAMRSEVFFLSY